MMDFINTGLPASTQKLFDLRAAHSETKIDDLRSSFAKSGEISGFPHVAIYCAGSYARLEASSFSDIDLFFVSQRDKEEYTDGYNVPMIRMMSNVIRIGDSLGFPKFSNDGQYLKILHVSEILDNLGGNLDDYKNHFTARLLMMLESNPIFDDESYNRIINLIVESYFRDYPGHEENFRPIFLINDIIRFWKTLCLNYENKRNQRDVTDDKKIWQKIRNFKLKYSRLLTCYASIAYLCSIDVPITQKHVVDMINMTPSNRLRSVMIGVPSAQSAINAALDGYHWFLERTNVDEAALFEYFSDENNRSEAFGRASIFGDQVYDVLREIDIKNNSSRYFVI